MAKHRGAGNRGEIHEAAGARSTLRELLEKALRERGLSKADLAVTLGVKADSLRGWIASNTFPEDVVTKLGLALRLDADSCAFRIKKYKPRRAAKLGGEILVDVARASFPELIRAHQRGQDVPIEAFFGKMGPGDSFAIDSPSEVPLELLPDGWMDLGTALLGAIANGAFFLFLGPVSAPDGQPQSSGINQAAGRSEAGSFMNMKSLFHALKRDVRRELEAMGKDPELAETHLLYVEKKLGPFGAPWHKTCLYRSADPKDDIYAAFGEFPLFGGPKRDALSPKVSCEFLTYLSATLQADNQEQVFTDMFKKCR